MAETSTPAPTRRRRRRTGGETVPILFSQPAAWAFLGMTRSRWFEIKGTTGFPSPVFLGTTPRPFWRRADLEAFVKKLPTSRRESVQNSG